MLTYKQYSCIICRHVYDVLYLSVIFHMLSSNGASVIALKVKVKEHLQSRHVVVLCFTKITVEKVAHI